MAASLGQLIIRIPVMFLHLLEFDRIIRIFSSLSINLWRVVATV